MKKTFASLTSLVGIGILMFASLSSHGATWNWNGADTGDDWSTGGNWVENSAPASQNDTTVNFSSSTGITPNADSAWTLQVMNFSGTGGSTTLSGGDLTLGGSASWGVVIDHVGSNGHAVTIENNISLVNSFDSIRSTGGGWNHRLFMNGDVAGPANGTLRFMGANGVIEVYGNITADRLFMAGGPGANTNVRLYGTNSVNSMYIEGGNRVGVVDTMTVSGEITNLNVIDLAANASLGTIANISTNSTGNINANGVSQTFSSFGASGNILGVNGNNNITYRRNAVDGDQDTGTGLDYRTNFVKEGDNTLSLTSAIQRRTGTTTVREGTLRMGGLHVGYQPNGITQLGAGAYLIESGATFAGDGTIITDNADFTVAGTLSAGAAASPGTLTLDLGTGTMDIANAESLVFRLGTASDLVLLTDYTDGDVKFDDGNSGTLNIGSGVIGFSDFLFSDSGGLGKGTYTLFDTETAIIGSLDGSDLRGWLTGDFYGTLGFADGGNDLVLTVTPNPTLICVR